MDVILSAEQYVVCLTAAAVVAVLVAAVSRVNFHRIRSFVSSLFSARPFAEGRPKPTLEAVPQRTQRGQALIELVLVLPLIFVFIMIIVDFGLALDRRQVIQHDVREGARAGAVGVGTTAIKAAAGEDPGTFDVDVCYVDEGGNVYPGDAGDTVRVSGTYVYQFTIGSGELLGVFGVDGGAWDITMTPTADARLETHIAGANSC